MTENITVDYAGRTDRGRQREANEDHFFVAALNKSMRVHESSIFFDATEDIYSGHRGQLYVVADGIGGDAAGERASELAITTVSQYVLNVLPWFFRLDWEDEDDIQNELKKAVLNCEEVITAESEAVPKHSGMGTTLTVAYVFWPTLYVVHVGDSRCYLHRGDTLEQITRDHTLAQALVDRGAMSAADAQRSPLVHILNNALGKGKENLQPDVYTLDLQAGDSLLLCTDGLTNELADDTIADILRDAQDASSACQTLVDGANAAGGSDNITVLVAAYKPA